MDKPQPIFSEGINFYRIDPAVKEKAPWLKGKVAIHPTRLTEWVKNLPQELLTEKGFLMLDLKESKDKGTLYFQVNTFKPKKQEVQESKTTSEGYNGETINPADIPFD